MQTQREMVLNHLIAYGSITAREADSKYGIMRLGARIYDLKKAGYAIHTKMEIGKNRFGGAVCYARYSLKEANNGSTDR